MNKFQVGQIVNTPKGEGEIVQVGTKCIVVKINEITYTIKKKDAK